MGTKADSIMAAVRHLAEGIGPRPPGSLAEAHAAEWIAAQFRTLGLNSALEPVHAPRHAAVDATLELPDHPQLTVEALPSQFSPDGDVVGPLRYLRHDPRDLDSADLRGCVVLWMPTGTLTERLTTLMHLQASGVAGLIVGSSTADLVQTKLVRYPEVDRLPVAAVSWLTASRLIRHQGDRIRLKIRTDPEQTAPSHNVVATIPGQGPNWVVLSAHHDTAPFSPGATDNAGGVASLLEVGRLLHDDAPLPATVYVVSTACEEYGRTDGVGAGAQAFLEARPDAPERCLGWVEIDGVGNAMGALSVLMGGPKPFRECIEAGDFPVGTRFPGKSPVGCDHGAAEQRGIPVVWFSDARGIPRPVYHTPGDTCDGFDPNLAASYIPGITKAIKRLASLEPVNPPIENGQYFLRQAGHEDVSSVIAITREAFGPVSGDCMAEAYFGEQLGGQPWHVYKAGDIARSMRADIYRFIVTEIDGQVVAYASFLTDETRGIAAIGNNAVHPDWQGRGIGSAQQREIDRRMRQEGYTRFKVVTLGNDIPAQRMYERLGYERISETINYLRGDGKLT